MSDSLRWPIRAVDEEIPDSDTIWAEEGQTLGLDLGSETIRWPIRPTDEELPNRFAVFAPPEPTIDPDNRIPSAPASSSYLLQAEAELELLRRQVADAEARVAASRAATEAALAADVELARLEDQHRRAVADLESSTAEAIGRILDRAHATAESIRASAGAGAGWAAQ